MTSWQDKLRERLGPPAHGPMRRLTDEDIDVAFAEMHRALQPLAAEEATRVAQLGFLPALDHACIVRPMYCGERGLIELVAFVFVQDLPRGVQ